MDETDPNYLPWEYHAALGYDGVPINENEAMRIVERVGITSWNELGHTPLSVAAMLGRTGIVNWLLGQGASVNFVPPNGKGRTPLLWACDQKRLEIVRALIDAGANLEAVNEFGHTPLATVFTNCFADPIPIADLLIRRGAIVTPKAWALGDEWNRQRFLALLQAHKDHKEDQSWPHK